METWRFSASGAFPNSDLPVVCYRQAVRIGADQDGADMVEDLFVSHKWSNTWRDGIFPYRHFHSISHEVIGIYEGQARLELGGAAGREVEVRKGDILVIPAGVAHRRLSSSADFSCIGAYPLGQAYDTRTGEVDELREVERNIDRVAAPGTDPVYGHGPLNALWNPAGSARAE